MSAAPRDDVFGTYRAYLAYYKREAHTPILGQGCADLARDQVRCPHNRPSGPWRMDLSCDRHTRSRSSLNSLAPAQHHLSDPNLCCLVKRFSDAALRAVYKLRPALLSDLFIKYSLTNWFNYWLVEPRYRLFDSFIIISGSRRLRMETAQRKSDSRDTLRTPRHDRRQE